VTSGYGIGAGGGSLLGAKGFASPAVKQGTATGQVKSKEEIVKVSILFFHRFS